VPFQGLPGASEGSLDWRGQHFPMLTIGGASSFLSFLAEKKNNLYILRAPDPFHPLLSCLPPVAVSYCKVSMKLELGHFFFSRFRVLARGSFTQIAESVFKTWFKNVVLAALCVSAKTQLDRTNTTIYQVRSLKK
jgi:hypothetical protein